MSQRLLKILVDFGRLEIPGNSRYITDEGILIDRKNAYFYYWYHTVSYSHKQQRLSIISFLFFLLLFLEPISKRHTNFHRITNQQHKIKGFVISVY